MRKEVTMTAAWEKLASQGLFVLPLQAEIAELEKLAFNSAQLLQARRDTDTSPSENKVEAGNYKKGHLDWNGIRIAIENPKGFMRSGKDKGGKPWSIKLLHDYGYFKGTEGKDGDHVDVFIGPHIKSKRVFVINQMLDGRFDEHKVIIGCLTEAEAREVYLSGYEKGWKGLGSIRSMAIPDFKKWVLDRKATKKQAIDYGG